ncbi:hypothetical protein BJ878DRAFT_483840 [Calycina marina]|uniref:Uncharacterized protein n=1 Tax=Calycina marina TaxID=1763456 RepID=A0A9P7YVE4_9HELO|nr:hypothetical protein BJ878DRAFT_483840 [Calycina marina]
MAEPNHEPVAQQQQQSSFQANTRSEEWRRGLFSCIDCGISTNDTLLLKAKLCSCLVCGKQQERLRNPTLKGYKKVGNDCLIFAGLAYCGGPSWLLNFFKRGELRERYDIRCTKLKTASPLHIEEHVRPKGLSDTTPEPCATSPWSGSISVDAGLLARKIGRPLWSQLQSPWLPMERSCLRYSVDVSFSMKKLKKRALQRRTSTMQASMSGQLAIMCLRQDGYLTVIISPTKFLMSLDCFN